MQVVGMEMKDIELPFAQNVPDSTPMNDWPAELLSGETRENAKTAAQPMNT